MERSQAESLEENLHSLVTDPNYPAYESSHLCPVPPPLPTSPSIDRSLSSMSLQITTGARSMLSLGVSLGDLAVAFHHGRSIGNWLQAAALDAELFESIMEQQGALLKRRGLVDAAHMKQRWSEIDFIYEGKFLKSSFKSKASEGQDLTEFSWLMVTIVTALDRVLPSSAIKALLLEVFAEILEGDEAMKQSLRVQLPTNVEAWRSVGCVRGMVRSTSTVIQQCYLKLVQQRAVPQLNTAELEEMKRFLIWLMAGTTNDFKVISATAYSVTESLRTAGVYVNTKGERRYEREPTVRYVEKPGPFDRLQLLPEDSKLLINAKSGVQTRNQLFSYPRGQPEAMIDAIPLGRDVLNRMGMCWSLGSKAAANVHLVPVTAEVRLPFDPTSDIYYKIEDYDLTRSKFGSMLSTIAEQGFPVATQLLLQALEILTKGIGPEREAWLHSHAALEYLQRGTDTAIGEPKNVEIWVQYQALVFGFYYKLLEPLISLEYVQQDVFFRGLWGHRSMTFLAMCTHFASCIRQDEWVSRTHILHMLATMYAGRQKPYAKVTSPPGLLGVLGPMSVLAAPLLRTTDVPNEIAKFLVVDLPVIDLLSDFDELYSGHGSGIQFTRPEVTMAPITPRGPTRPWTVHAKLGKLYGDTQNGVMMAARCDGRLVGWFGPLAADFTFLSSCYQTERNTDEPGYEDESVIQGYEITDEDWQNCLVPRLLAEGSEEQISVVHSRGCAALRYAATGFLANADEEVAIATDDVSVAAGRLQAQGAGIVIA